MKYKKLANYNSYCNNFKGGKIDITLPDDLEIHISDDGFYILGKDFTKTETYVDNLNNLKPSSIMFTLPGTFGRESRMCVTSDFNFFPAYRNLDWMIENSDKIVNSIPRKLVFLYNDKTQMIKDRVSYV